MANSAEVCLLRFPRRVSANADIISFESDSASAADPCCAIGTDLDSEGFFQAVTILLQSIRSLHVCLRHF